jgi:hypothetical protein
MKFSFSAQYTETGTKKQIQLAQADLDKAEALKNISDLLDQHEAGTIILRAASAFPDNNGAPQARQ